MEVLQDHGMLLRWLHFVAGVTWIGLLWFFNWVNGPFSASLEPEVRSKVIPQLMPRALWWFRWGAAFTWLSGVVYAMLLAKSDPEATGVMDWFASTTRGNWIGMGFLYGTIMAFNVWVMIWPRQKKIISATIRGEKPDPAWGKVATTCSRMNTYLSVPLLFAMGAGKHLGEFGGDMPTSFLTAAAIVTVVGMAVAWFFIHVLGPRVGKDFKPVG